MKYWQFVNWEPAPIESALKSAIYAVLGKYQVLKIVEVE